MKFYSEPNMLVRVNKKGRLKRIKNFRFDQNGVFETDNPYLIQALTKRFGKEVEETELTDEEVRTMAKEKGIKSWHVKKIENLKDELGLM